MGAAVWLLGCSGVVGAPPDSDGEDDSARFGTEPGVDGSGAGATDGSGPAEGGDDGPPFPVDDNGTPLDEDGNPLLDADGNPLMVNEEGVIVDADGNPVTDADGNPLVVDDNTGADGIADSNPGELPADPDVSPEPIELSDCSTPGPRQVRRLTAQQYARTLQSIFNDPNLPQQDVLADASVLGFNVDAKASVVRDLEGELLMNYAESVADWAVDNGRVSQFTSCTEQRAQCQREFVANFGAQAHREPPDDARVESYRTLFDQEESFDDGARAVISAMLQSPFTIYRREMGTERGGEFELTPYEVASQLSYWLTDAPPDAQLYDAAANDRLITTQDFLREAERLLQTEYARQSLARFVEAWLHIDKLRSKAKDDSVMPLPAELRTSMVEETREFFLQTFYGGGSLSDLFTARHSYVDQRLASLYELGSAGDGFQRVDLSDSDRPAGLLGHAAFLTTHALSDNSSPVQRAKVVIERLLCGSLPAVPSDLNVTLDTETEFTTNRERYEVHRQRSECALCHENLDPLGYAFEHFDGFGRYREQENGYDIDATGELAYLASGPVALDGVDSLSEALAESPELQACLVRYWSYYTFGAEDWAEAECNRDSVIRYAREEDFTLRSVLLGIVQAPHFSRRVVDR